MTCLNASTLALALCGLLALASPASAIDTASGNAPAFSGTDGTIVLAEWQGGKPATSNKGWNQGGGYGGQSGSSGNEGSGSGSSWRKKFGGSGEGTKPSNPGGNANKDSGIFKGADPCTVKHVPGSPAWNACKGIKANVPVAPTPDLNRCETRTVSANGGFAMGCASGAPICGAVNNGQKTCCCPRSAPRRVGRKS